MRNPVPTPMFFCWNDPVISHDFWKLNGIEMFFSKVSSNFGKHLVTHDVFRALTGFGTSARQRHDLDATRFGGGSCMLCFTTGDPSLRFW